MLKTLFCLSFFVLADSLVQILLKMLSTTLVADWLQRGVLPKLDLFAFELALSLVLAYGLCLVLYLFLLRHFSLGALYATAHLNIAVVMAFSLAFLNERYSLTQMLGAALIVAGIALAIYCEIRDKKLPAQQNMG